MFTWKTIFLSFFSISVIYTRFIHSVKNRNISHHVSHWFGWFIVYVHSIKMLQFLTVEFRKFCIHYFICVTNLQFLYCKVSKLIDFECVFFFFGKRKLNEWMTSTNNNFIANSKNQPKCFFFSPSNSQYYKRKCDWDHEYDLNKNDNSIFDMYWLQSHHQRKKSEVWGERAIAAQ